MIAIFSDGVNRRRLTCDMIFILIHFVHYLIIKHSFIKSINVSIQDKQYNPHTMASLKCAKLFLCGEVLDIAGPVGGYNLQAAFATGYVAGESSSK